MKTLNLTTPAEKRAVGLATTLFGLGMIAHALLSGIASAAEPAAEPPQIARYVAIDNVCAWPNLTLMPDGSINTTIFGQPSHGQVAGAAECWNKSYTTH